MRICTKDFPDMRRSAENIKQIHVIEDKGGCFSGICREEYMAESKIMGYARVSSSGQKLDRQILELKKYVSEENIVVDKISGKSLDRPGYQALKGILGLRRGDCLYVKSLDRLSRNKEDIKSELIWFKENGITLRILDLPTTMLTLEENQQWIQDMVNNILIEVMASLAEQERIMIRQRQREGIEAAKQKGKHLGRPEKGYPLDWAVYYTRYRSGELTRKYIMEQLGISADRFKYLVRKYEKERGEKGGK